MKTYHFILSASLLVLASACGQPVSNEDLASDVTSNETAGSDTAAEAIIEPAQNILTLRAVGLTFEAPDTIEGGWTRIEFENMSGMTHFAIVERLPDSITTADQVRDVAPPFQLGMDLIAAGDMDGAMAAFGQLPEWFGEIIFLGGPGLLTGNGPSSSTIFLEPGTYSIECYVKTGGIFHSYNPDGMGMYHQLIVTESIVDTAPPEPDVILDINNEGYSLRSGAFQSGQNTVEVHYLDQTVYPNFVGHDVHVVRMDGADTDAVIDWMDWRVPGALETPAPAEFIGGINEMPAGSIGYFTVDLTPGEYALIAEIPDADDTGHFLAFTVQE